MLPLLDTYLRRDYIQALSNDLLKSPDPEPIATALVAAVVAIGCHICKSKSTDEPGDDEAFAYFQEALKCRSTTPVGSQEVMKFKVSEKGPSYGAHC